PGRPILEEIETIQNENTSTFSHQTSLNLNYCLKNAKVKMNRIKT
ncbi:unnamed protein product, partial [Brachionus calyciflorus]